MLSFPSKKPDVPMDMHGWFDDRNKDFLKPLLADAKHIIELGSWLGKSTRWFCENSQATVYAVDHWQGSIEHQERNNIKDKLPTLYETFLVNCWHFYHRIKPIRMNTQAGLAYLADNDIKPDIIFVDASHEYEDVLSDLELASHLFPKAILTGDDWSWKNRRFEKRKTVREAVKAFCKKHKFKCIHNDRCWRIQK